MGFRNVVASSPLLALVFASIACGSSDAFDTITGPPDGGVADTLAEDVPVLPIDGSDTQSDTYVPPSKCGEYTATGSSTICVKVTKGSSVAPPHVDADSRAIGIDGYGALYVALLADPYAKTAKPIVTRTFPSASSSTRFSIETDLPKVAELTVPPGSYYVVAFFYDQEPAGSRDFAAGDYVPHIENGWDLPKVEVGSGAGRDVEVQLFPVRSVDVTVKLKSGVKPVGNAIGPLMARLSTTSKGDVVGSGFLPCADLGKPTALRLVTTASPDTFALKVALFDFAAGPDDPVVDALGTPPPAGSLVDYGGTSTPPTIKLADGWVTPPVTVTLDRVVPYEPTPSDPTSACVAAGAAPVK